jgi:hypothetical protein
MNKTKSIIKAAEHRESAYMTKRPAIVRLELNDLSSQYGCEKTSTEAYIEKLEEVNSMMRYEIDNLIDYLKSISGE